MSINRGPLEQSMAPAQNTALGHSDVVCFPLGCYMKCTAPPMKYSCPKQVTLNLIEHFRVTFQFIGYTRLQEQINGPPRKQTNPEYGTFYKGNKFSSSTRKWHETKKVVRYNNQMMCRTFPCWNKSPINVIFKATREI